MRSQKLAVQGILLRPLKAVMVEVALPSMKLSRKARR